jgi:hypothetical protein
MLLKILPISAMTMAGLLVKHSTCGEGTPLLLRETVRPTTTPSISRGLIPF